MHLGLWRKLVSARHQRVTAVRQRGMLVWEKKRKFQRWEGLREGSLGEFQPRMRLDLPPGGFLRPDAAPAAGSSVDGGSSSCSGPASLSALLLSEHRSGWTFHIYEQT